jgi:chromate transporter
MVTGLAWAYTRNGTVEGISDLRYGILPVVAAIVAHAGYKLGRTAVRSPLTATVGLAAAIAYVAGTNELAILAVGAAATGLWGNRHRLATGTPAVLPWAMSALSGITPVTDPNLGLGRLFWSFLKIGALLFGSGYVVVAFIEAEFVDRLGVLSTDQVADAVAAGQVTPGPLFTTATFVGYLTHGLAGALVATVAIFLPAFVLVSLLGRFVTPVLRRPAVRPVLDGLNAASVGLIFGVAIDLAGQGVNDLVTVAVALAALVVLLATKLNPTWLIAGGLLIGIANAIV